MTLAADVALLQPVVARSLRTADAVQLQPADAKSLPSVAVALLQHADVKSLLAIHADVTMDATADVALSDAVVC